MLSVLTTSSRVYSPCMSLQDAPAATIKADPAPSTAPPLQDGTAAKTTAHATGQVKAGQKSRDVHVQHMPCLPIMTISDRY